MIRATEVQPGGGRHTDLVGNRKFVEVSYLENCAFVISLAWSLVPVMRGLVDQEAGCNAGNQLRDVLVIGYMNRGVENGISLAKAF